MDAPPPRHEFDILQPPQPLQSPEPFAFGSSVHDDELSDHQIYQLLKGAEQRLGSALKDDSGASANQDYSPISSLQNRLVTGNANGLSSLYIKMTSQGAQVDPALLVTARQRKLASGARTVEDPVQAKYNLEKAKFATAGADWYNIPRTKLTPELKRDLQLLRSRSVLDPKRHYKKENGKIQIPEFSQTGIVIEGPTEFFSARLNKKDRKRTFVEEILAGERATQRFKSKYNDIQRAKTSGKKAHYKKLKAKRTPGSSSG